MLKITQEDIEKKTVDFVLSKGRNPRYILMDKASYAAFNEMFTPKEKAELFFEKDVADAQITQMHVIHDVIVGILSVNTDTDLFDIV